MISSWLPQGPAEGLVYLMYMLMNWEETYERKIWKEYKMSKVKTRKDFEELHWVVRKRWISNSKAD